MALDNDHKFQWNFSSQNVSLTGIVISKIHKMTKEAITSDTKAHLFKKVLKNLPLPLQNLLWKDVETTNCKLCREFIEELSLFKDINNDDIDKYFLYMKSDVTLGSEKCSLR